MKRKDIFTTSLFAVALFLAWPLPAQGSFEWKSASPKNLGLDGKKIQAFLAELPDTLVTSCLIVKDGTIASEYYKAGCGADSVFSMQSVSKSVTSAIVRIAIQQGYFKLDDAISQFFPEAKNLAVCRGESKALFEKITVRHLLTNTSGLVSTASAVWGQWRASGDWIKFLFDRPMLHEPGKVFEYSTARTRPTGAGLAILLIRLTPDLAVAVDEVFYGCERFKAHRAADVKLLRADSKLGAKAKFKAVGKAR